MKDIIVIVGPTGVGKTKLSIALAKRINAEIINADSMQFYRGFDIGTAKVGKQEQEEVSHHLLDIVDFSSMYTIYDYQKDCRQKIEEIRAKKKRVIIVGGSGLYIRAALYDYKLIEEAKKPIFEDYSNEELYEKVKKIDKDTQIHPNNRKRMERFLTKMENQEENPTNAKPLYDFTMIGLTTEREKLYETINQRVDQMIEKGLLEEVKGFYDSHIFSKALETGIGYKEWIPYFKGEKTKEDVIEEIKRNSRRYAKRQYTFFRHQFDVKWYKTDYENFDHTIEEVYHDLKESAPCRDTL